MAEGGGNTNQDLGIHGFPAVHDQNCSDGESIFATVLWVCEVDRQFDQL